MKLEIGFVFWGVGGEGLYSELAKLKSDAVTLKDTTNNKMICHKTVHFQ